jgi:hypothetical protein
LAIASVASTRPMRPFVSIKPIAVFMNDYLCEFAIE